MISSAIFKNCPQIVSAASNSPALRSGSRGAGVAIIQAVLASNGAHMPITMASGVPDGRFGRETHQAIFDFQASRSQLQADGIAGRNTIRELDLLALSKESDFANIKFKQPPQYRRNEYTIGSTNPQTRSDGGAGRFGSKLPTYEFSFYRHALLQVLPYYQGQFGWEAADFIIHFLNATGTDKIVSPRAMLHAGPADSSNPVFTAYQTEVCQAQMFASTLPVGTHQIRSTRVSIATANYGSWYYAVNGFQYWGMATVFVTMENGVKTYQMHFTFNIYDRYNWDLGEKSITIDLTDYGAPDTNNNLITVDDQTVGEFVRQGLAREFDTRGAFVEIISWREVDAIDVDSVPVPSRY
ncbi:MAG: peptidoglycan-binding protein [Pirellulaceae bacterium]|nr:peptidoglycan-binding protein [Pirellulaceae bacterium]